MSRADWRRIGKETGWLAGAEAEDVLDPEHIASLEDMDVTVEQAGLGIWAVYVNDQLLVTSACQNCVFAVAGLLQRLWRERIILMEKTKSDSE